MSNFGVMLVALHDTKQVTVKYSRVKLLASAVIQEWISSKDFHTRTVDWRTLTVWLIGSSLSLIVASLPSLWRAFTHLQIKNRSTPPRRSIMTISTIIADPSTGCVESNIGYRQYQIYHKLLVIALIKNSTIRVWSKGSKHKKKRQSRTWLCQLNELLE